MRGSISAAVIAVAFSAGGCATDEMPDDYGELGLAVTGETAAASYRVVVSDTAGKLLLEREIKPNQVVAPSDSRFAAALPADVLLLVQVFALDGAGTELGAGATFVRLVAAETTQIAIDVVAYQSGGSAGILDASISEAALPARDYLFPDPAESAPGQVQTVVAHLTDVTSKQPVQRAIALSLAGAVAPMFLPQSDGSVAATWTWEQPASYPAMAGVELAYLDDRGRGWIASARAKFPSDGAIAPIDFGWIGQVHVAGVIGPIMSQWLVGIVGPSHLQFLVDANGDGDFADPGERASFAAAGNARPIVFELTDPTQIVMPVDIAGAIFDQNGDGKLDTIATIGANGAIASTQWPLK